MKINFIILAAADLLLMALTVVLGLMVQGDSGFARHFLLGMITCLFTCFVHIVLFMYFVVQSKIIEQSILRNDISASYADRARKLKGRALTLSLIGIVSMIVTGVLGAAIENTLSASPHFIAAFLAMFINTVLMVCEFALIDENRAMCIEAFGE